MSSARPRVGRLTTLLALIFSYAGLSSRAPQDAGLTKILEQVTQAERDGRFADAERLSWTAAKTAEKLGPNNPQLGNILLRLAGLYLRQGEAAKAVDLAKQALAADKKAFGPEHPRVAMDFSGLAVFYQGLRDKNGEAEAEACLKRAVAILESNPKTQDQQLFAVLNNFWQFYSFEHRYAEAEVVLQRALEVEEKSPERSELDLVNLRLDLAQLYRQEGKEEEAERLSAEIREQHTTRGNVQLTEAINAKRLADQYRGQGNPREAEENYKRSIATLEEAQNSNFSGLLPQALEGLAEVYVSEGRDSEAQELFKRALNTQEKAAGEHRDMAEALSFPFALLNFYRDHGRLSEIEPVFLRALEIQATVLGPQNAAVGETSYLLAEVYREEGKNEESLPFYQRASEIQERNLGPNHPTLGTTLQQYAMALRALGRDSEANAAASRAEAIRNRTTH